MKNNQKLTLLGDITAEQFLSQYWQKKPLLIKQAIPKFAGFLTPDELAGLSCESEVQSRLIRREKSIWVVEDGPFDDEDFTKLPDKDWTLLVQTVNHHIPEAYDLLRQFNFIPTARLDDLMVSYAPDGGGVGAHVDTYDVFLLQGQGKRHWQWSNQKDLSLVEDAPLKLLKNFEMEDEYVLEAGDMLYLPPQYAHWGVAVGECMTYSIGFRAPSHQELASEFLNYMQDELHQGKTSITGMYQDADLSLQTAPAEIGGLMIDKVNTALSAITWNTGNIADFLGRYLTEPKTHILFEPNKKLSLKKFIEKSEKLGLGLDLKSMALFQGEYFYLNGEPLQMSKNRKVLIELANSRYLSAESLIDFDDLQPLYDWYLAGYLQFQHS